MSDMSAASATPSSVPGVLDADTSAHGDPSAAFLADAGGESGGDSEGSAEVSPAPAPAGKQSAKAEPPKPGAPKPEAKPEPPPKRQFKFKVDGKEIVEEYDDAAVQRRLQMALAAEKRIREANEQTQQARQILEAFQADPVDAMRRFYGDEAVEKFFWTEAQRRHQQDQRYAQVPEEQRALMRELDELKIWKQQQEEAALQARQQAEQQARERETARVREFRLKELSDSLTRGGYAPQDPYMLEVLLPRAAEVWDDVPDLSADQVVSAAQEMADRDTRQTLLRMTDDQIERTLGEERLQALMRRRIEKLRAASAPAMRPAEAAPPQTKPTSTNETLRRAREATFGPQRPGAWRLPR